MADLLRPNCGKIWVLFGVMMAFGAKSAACAAEQNADRYTDDWFGFSVDAPQGWNRGTLQRYSVPGTIRAGWAGPRESSIVVFAQEPGPQAGDLLPVQSKRRAAGPR